MTYRLPPSLAAHLRNWGLVVVEIDGWKQRGRDFPAKPEVVVDHHTGTPERVPGDLPTKNVLINGRSDLPGPLCQFGLGRSGTVYLVASGKANHAGKGSWDGVDVGNSHSVGVEAESAGDGHWTLAQLHTYPLLNAALCDFLDIPARRVCAHRESALPHGRKDDPTGIDMDLMRAKVARLLKTGPHSQAQTVTPEGDEMTADDWKRLEKMLDTKIDAAAKGLYDKLHGDLVVILHGDDKGHVNSIDSIAKQVGVPQK